MKALFDLNFSVIILASIHRYRTTQLFQCFNFHLNSYAAVNTSKLGFPMKTGTMRSIAHIYESKLKMSD